MANRTPKNCPHRSDAGFVAAQRNPWTSGWVVVYEAEAQGLDPAGGRFVVVCRRHATLCNTPAKRDAFVLMRSVEFCEPCMAACRRQRKPRIEDCPTGSAFAVRVGREWFGPLWWSDYAIGDLRRKVLDKLATEEEWEVVVLQPIGRLDEALGGDGDAV